MIGLRSILVWMHLTPRGAEGVRQQRELMLVVMVVEMQHFSSAPEWPKIGWGGRVGGVGGIIFGTGAFQP